MRGGVDGPLAWLGGDGALEAEGHGWRHHQRDANGFNGDDVERPRGVPVVFKSDAVMAIWQREREAAVAIGAHEQAQSPAHDHHAGRGHGAAGIGAHYALDTAKSQLRTRAFRSPATRPAAEGSYWRDTTKRLIEYPNTPPMNTSERK